MTEEELLQRYYKARKCCNSEFSGNLSGDWRKLADEVNEYSIRRFGKPFDFGDDPAIYQDNWWEC